MPDWAFYYIRFPKRDSLEKATEFITIIYFIHLNHVLEMLQEVPVQVGYILVFTFIHFKSESMAVLNIFYQYFGVFNIFTFS